MKFHRVNLARALSKLGYCSRSKAIELIREGHVRVNGEKVLEPGQRVIPEKDCIAVNGENISQAGKIYIMLNKQPGLVTTAKDEKARKTIYSCFEGSGIQWIFPVGRLDRASEGLLLLTNDTRWASHIMSPENHVDRVYHVQVRGIVPQAVLEIITQGVEVDNGEVLKAKNVDLLRQGTETCWLEIVLDEGKNRHIRRLFKALEIKVLRIVRVAIGSLKLGDLKKGQFRYLSKQEIII